MKVLVINCGSSSLKYQLIDSDSEAVLAKGICERIKLDGELTHQAAGKEKITVKADMPDHSAAVKLVLEKLLDPELGAIKDVSEINAVGHRVVHGGEKFASSALIDDEVLAAIEECNDLAPLHNPANLIGIRACQKLMPGVPQVAVFDTAFHQTMPECAYIYGIPYEYYEKYKIRRYGFHGTSHSYVSARTAEILGKPVEDTKIIVCHLGGGSSISAVQGGKSIDTTMGLTPLEGIPMGTRSGNIDPAIVEYIAAKENMDIKQVMDVLNKKSGVLGISGKSSDFRDLEEGIASGDKRCEIAMNVFCYQVAKVVGGYIAAMNGVDAIVFTAGVGENNARVRKLVCERFGYLGVELDEEANSLRGQEVRISSDNSKLPVYVVPTNEELAIARETVALV
jgi:acetate kinase